ncbi:MAG: M43 family zinc metalloprotease [Myxococcota bacterium]|nr:M43 family zinc metalloprotease [Myxococcota bacterium]
MLKKRNRILLVSSIVCLAMMPGRGNAQMPLQATTEAVNPDNSHRPSFDKVYGIEAEIDPEKAKHYEQQFEARILGDSWLSGARSDKAYDKIVRSQILKDMGKKTMVAPEHLEIPIIFHVMNDHSNNTADSINVGMDNINAYYAPTWFRFKKNWVSWHESGDTIIEGTSEQLSLKEKYTVHPENVLNVFIVQELEKDNGNGLRGTGSFPWMYQDELDDLPGQGQYSHHQGVIMERIINFYNVVTTSTFPHEVGHYLGLYHTFQNGVENNGDQEEEDAPGDYVDDTPCQWKDAVGCSAANTCIDYGPNDPGDPIGNLMTYINHSWDADDDCRDWFSDGQKWRMINAVLYYRYELLPDVTDLSESSYLQGSGSALSNGWAAAHEEITNTGTAIISPNQNVTAEVISHSGGRIVLKPGFHAMSGSTFVAKVTNGVPGACSDGDTKHVDCDIGQGRDWVCHDGHWVLLLDDCLPMCVTGQCQVDGVPCCEGHCIPQTAAYGLCTSL